MKTLELSIGVILFFLLCTVGDCFQSIAVVKKHTPNGWHEQVQRKIYVVSHSHNPRKSSCRSNSSLYRSSSSSSRDGRSSSSELMAFLWFGGGNDDEEGKDDEPDEIAAANLREVSAIMDSMSKFKSSQRVGERVGSILQDLSNTIVEGASADGKVKVSYNGQQQPIGVQIDEAYLQSIKNRKGAEELGIAMTKAMQDAHTKSGLKMEEKLKSLYSDLGFDS